MSAQASFEVCGMMILTAGAMGLDAVDRLSDFASQVKPEAVDPAARPLFSAIVRNLELGRPPTEANLLDADGSISGRALATAKDAASQQVGGRHRGAQLGVHPPREPQVAHGGAGRQPEGRAEPPLGDRGPSWTCSTLLRSYRANLSEQL